MSHDTPTTSPYRKVSISTWSDKRVRSLSPIPASGQSLFLMLMVGPQTTSMPGVQPVGRMALAEMLGWHTEDFDQAFAEVMQQGLAKADWQARFVFLPNAIRHNMPQSPNVVKSWAATWASVAECALKTEAWHTIFAALKAQGESFAHAFQTACPLRVDGMPVCADDAVMQNSGDDDGSSNTSDNASDNTPDNKTTGKPSGKATGKATDEVTGEATDIQEQEQKQKQEQERKHEQQHQQKQTQQHERTHKQDGKHKAVPQKHNAGNDAHLLGCQFLTAQGVDEQVARDWLRVRKEKNAPLTHTAWKRVVAEAAKANITPADAVRMAAENSWRGFEAAWVENKRHPKAVKSAHGFDPTAYGSGGKL